MVKDLKHKVLNHRITFQAFTTIVNDYGFEIQEWSDFKTVWAGITNLSGREYFAAMQVQAEKTVKFTIRYTKDIDETMNIKFGKKTVGTEEIDIIFNITSIDNIKYGNEFMEIKALAVM